MEFRPARPISSHLARGRDNASLLLETKTCSFNLPTDSGVSADRILHSASCGNLSRGIRSKSVELYLQIQAFNLANRNSLRQSNDCLRGTTFLFGRQTANL